MDMCERCGSELVEGAAFCHACGAPSSARRNIPREAAKAPGAEAHGAGGPATAPPLPYPPPAAPLAPLPSDGVPSRYRAEKASGWAIASLVFGILSFMCLPFLGGVLAVVLAFVARSRKRGSRGEAAGDGLATAGLALGMIIGALGQVALQLPGLRGIRLRPGLQLRHPDVRRIGKLYVPVMIGISFSLVGVTVDRALAAGVSDMAAAQMRFATTLIQLALSRRAERMRQR